MSDVVIERLIGTRYRVLRALGGGGMGTVYAAADEQNERQPVALKLIREKLSDDDDAGARFDREIKALRELDHENIVRFLDAGTEEDGLRWLAMELLEGRTLKERIQTRGSMPWQETLPIVRGMVAALEAAHAKGLIHRDLKPENVMLVGDVVKLLDFGVAKHTQLPDGMTMTNTGMIVGTPGFVAPEVVLHGKSDDPRSDFYGLGATWFEMLTGAKPFDAATPFALAMRHVNEPAPRPSDLRPFSPVPLPVEHLLARLLAKTAEERPQNAAMLLRDIDRLALAAAAGIDLSGSSVDRTQTDLKTPVLPVGFVTSPPMATPTTKLATAEPGANRVAYAVAALAVITVLVVAVASLARDHGAAPPVTSTGPDAVALPPPPAVTTPVLDVLDGPAHPRDNPAPPLSRDSAAGTENVEPPPVKPVKPRTPRPVDAHKPQLLDVRAH